MVKPHFLNTNQAGIVKSVQSIPELNLPQLKSAIVELEICICKYRTDVCLFTPELSGLYSRMVKPYFLNANQAGIEGRKTFGSRWGLGASM